LRATAAEADTVAVAFAAKVRRARAARARHRMSKAEAYADMYRARQAYRLALARYHGQAALFRRSDRRTKTAEQGQRDALARRAALRAAYADFSRECYGEWLAGHPHTFREIASQYGVTADWSRRVYARAIKKLRTGAVQQQLDFGS